jgi:CheY-like chemotaxis protein
MRILVADADAFARETLALLLECKGHKVYRAYDGKEALEAAQTLRPDAAVLEVKMPRLSGYDVARSVRTRSWAHDTVLIAYSEWGRDSDKDLAFEAGFDRHLSKPADLSALNRILDETSREVGPSF